MDLSTVPDGWRGLTPTPISPADAYNGYVAATVVYALDRMALLDRIERGEVLYRDDLTGERAIAEGVLRAATACGYLKSGDGVYVPTEAGREVARTRGYFTWMIGGYGPVFGHAGQLGAGTERYDVDVHRDGHLVALGSAQADRAMYANLLDRTIAGIEFAVVADLGSGDSTRVRRIVERRPGTRGLGVDISEPATAAARRGIAEAGLADRVSAIRADVLDVLSAGRHRDALGEADAVLSFFLLHDLLADPATRSSVLPRMREAFPRARTFVLADTMLQPAGDGQDRLPIFSAGFELAHALMGVPLHTKETYERLFAAAGLTVEQAAPLATPHSWLYVLRAS